MKKTLVGLITLSTVVIMTGCGTTGGTHTYNAPSKPTTQTTIYSGGGDVTINDVDIDNGGTYIKNEDGTVTYSTGDGSGNVATAIGDGQTATPGDGGTGEDSRDGEYDPSWDQSECNSHGYFYCTLANECRDEPLEGSSCTSNEAMNIKIKIY